jgi:hypothetical protein
MPEFPPGQSTTASGYLRYEDATQEGNLLPIAIPQVLASLWREVLVGHTGARNALAAGVLPILTRMTLVSADQKIRIDRPIESCAGFLLAYSGERDDDRRLYMNVWAEVRGAAGKLSRHVTPGESALCGSLFAEHTFTRLMAPPDQRRVSRLGFAGYPEIPDVHYPAPPPASAGEPPDAHHWIDELAPDPAEYCFTLDQTDANQHVNSLTYIRLFIEAVNRRLAATGRALKVRTRAVDIAYRKPCFAGDRVRAHVRLFEPLGAAGFIAGDDGKPRCYVRVILG